MVTSPDSPPVAPAPLLAPGSVVGKFTVVREIGSGGMCVVFEARHNDLQRAVALKVLKPELAAQPALVERFLAEGRKAAKVRHAHVIDMIDVGEANGVVYLAMELLDGEDLASRLKRDGPLDARTTVDLLLPVVAAVAEAHAAGVVHRDLKPANIFLCVDKQGHTDPKVLDFGIAKSNDEGGQRQTATGAILGTPFYMAPEQAEESKHVDHRADQYSLGVVLYECVTGALPFRGSTVLETLMKVERGEFVPPRVLAPTLAEGFEAIVVKAMSRDPTRRFGSVTEMGTALLPYASADLQARWGTVFSRAPVAVTRGEPKTPTKATFSRRHVALALAATAGVALLFAAMGYAWKHRAPPAPDRIVAADVSQRPVAASEESPSDAATAEVATPNADVPLTEGPRSDGRRSETRRSAPREPRGARPDARDAGSLVPVVTQRPEDASRVTLPRYGPDGVRVIE